MVELLNQLRTYTSIGSPDGWNKSVPDLLENG
jgi:hypothetical protein